MLLHKSQLTYPAFHPPRHFLVLQAPVGRHIPRSGRRRPRLPLDDRGRPHPRQQRHHLGLRRARQRRRRRGHRRRLHLGGVGGGHLAGRKRRRRGVIPGMDIVGSGGGGRGRLRLHLVQQGHLSHTESVCPANTIRGRRRHHHVLKASPGVILEYPHEMCSTVQAG